MGAHHSGTLEDIKNPGPYTFGSGFKMIMIALAVIGIATFAAGLSMGKTESTWSGFLINHFYFLLLGLGGLFFAGVQWATGAMWSAPVRRIAESFTAYIPFAIVSFLVVAIGAHSIYEWTHTEVVQADHILSGKTGYLNMPFFIIRNLVALAIWIFFTMKLIGNSIRQDAHKPGSADSEKLSGQNRKFAPIFLILFALTFTMMSFDQMMSLEPHWFSTIFGVYCFAGLFYANLALTCILTIYFKRKGPLKGIVNDNHLHDLGKFMFAFTVFWAYIGFSQFMLIWYANLPEETTYFFNRIHGGWLGVSIFLLVGKFLIPFFLLLPRDAKRKESLLLGVGVFMLIAQWVDVMWMVQPAFFSEGPHISWIEIGITLGFVGIFGLLVSRFLSKYNLVAMGDPKLVDSVFNHHQ